MQSYQNLLSCWHKLEHFSPASLPKGKNIKELKSAEPLPWERNISTTQKNTRIEHTLYLGVFSFKDVTDFIKEHFKDNTEEVNGTRGMICQASFKVNEDGIYLKESFGISTLTWALGQLEEKQIKTNDWAQAFQDKKNALEDSLEYIFNDYITHKDILTVQKKTTQFSKWSIKPALQIYYKTEEKFVSAKNLEENKANAEILNSFYIQDLERIIKNEKFKSFSPIKTYLDGCLNKPIHKIDLSSNTEEIKKKLTPQKIPDGCWPSDYNLSLMQQYAVNTVYEKLAGCDKSGIFSVNGPPGTGKTTLLRDIISANIVKRAKELIKYEYPHEAFTKIGAFNNPFSDFKPLIYSLDDALCNTGAVIASSNNGAVENVSKELPLKKETGSYKNDIEYFRNVSETCIDKGNWGLISAVLGNKENRNKLVSSIWFNKQKGITDLNTLLKLKNKSLVDWENAKQDFNVKLSKVESEKKLLDKCLFNYYNYNITLKKYNELRSAVDNIKQKVNTTNKKLEHLNLRKESIISNTTEASNHLAIIQQSRPGFFTYWFNKKIRKQYKANYNTAFNNVQQCHQELFALNKEIKTNESELEKHSSELNRVETEKSKAYSKFTFYQGLVEKDKEILGINYADDLFWEKINSKNTQISCPWYSDNLKRYQSELFISALKLQETFICVANEKSNRVVTTLSAFFEYLKENSITLPKEEAKGLWDIFFLVFPVVSTTFASIQTMFRDLAKDDIPWLFIDEAGQAVPQAAAGAIYRSKRVVVVGDPLQIEPVVTIPPAITNNISKYFSLNDDTISSELSVQAMTDRVNPLGMKISDKWVGTPLKVHRRCINPMFDIANKIAYENNMVLATPENKIPKIKFETKFIHCTGTVSGRHWVKEQGEIIKQILIDEIKLARKLPNIYVISPFSEVAYQLNKECYGSLINTYKPFYNGNQETLVDTFNKWINSSIGTVHTFQGKQAEGVIMCLGLDANSKGAANWAASKPNLLNVALTRAKYRFIAVGDKNIWLKQRFFNELSNLN